MKIKKEELKEALAIVKPGLANKELIEQSTSFAFVNGRVVTYNDEVSISHPVKGLELTGAIKAEELYSLLGKLKEDEIEIEVTNKEIQITCGRTKAGLVLEEEIKLPLEEIGELTGWQDLPKDFIEGLSFVLPACGRDMSRAVLTCVHIVPVGGVEASDGFKVARYKLESKMPFEDDFLLPATAAKLIVTKNVKQIIKSEGWAHFLTEEGSIISCRILYDKFPDVHPHLSITDGVELTLPNSLEEVMDRARVFTSGMSDMDESVLITIDNNKLMVESKNSSGWFKEQVNMKYKDKKIMFGVTPILFGKILNKNNTCKIGENKILFKEANKWEYMLLLRKVPQDLK